MSPAHRNEMNLQELFDAVSTHLTPSRVKDMKTAVRVFANVLGYPTPVSCPQTAYHLPIENIYGLLDPVQAGKGKSVQRNTKNSLSLLFRTACKHDLLPTNAIEESPSSRPNPPFNWEERTARKGSECSKPKHYYLRKKEWPRLLTEDFEAFSQWAVAEFVEDRSAEFKKRPSTIKNYRQNFSAYFGYLYHKENVPADDLRIDLLFDPERLRRFVTWHINTLHKRVTRTIELFLLRVIAMLKQYKPNPIALEAVTKLRGALAKPEPVYNKEEVWVSLADLKAIGQAFWPTRMPRGINCTGKGHARAAVMSLMISLWCQRPLRQRNMREMQLIDNLYKDDEGNWKIHFVGEELKVGRKKGRQNDYDQSFPADLVPNLNEYLSFWRPLLIKDHANPPKEVFLSMEGTPFKNEQHLHLAVVSRIYSQTGKRFHPHMFRTVWATEYIRETHDFYGAAVMLNDTLETVIRDYAEVLDYGTVEKADAWFEKKIQEAAKADLSNPSAQTLGPKILSLLEKDPLLAALLSQHTELPSKILTTLMPLFTESARSSMQKPGSTRAYSCSPTVPPLSHLI